MSTESPREFPGTLLLLGLSVLLPLDVLHCVLVAAQSPENLMESCLLVASLASLRQFF